MVFSLSEIQVCAFTSSAAEQKERKNKILRTADIYFVTSGFLIKYSTSGAQSFKQSKA